MVGLLGGVVGVEWVGVGLWGEEWGVKCGGSDWNIGVQH